jgi:hypothetical protein
MKADYLQVIRYKTAKAVRGGGAAGRDHRRWQVTPLIEQAMAVYGGHLGTAFQLIDDVLDYSGAEVETGKHLGDDLAEGKPTLPLIFVLRDGNARNRLPACGSAIENGGRDDFPDGPGCDSCHRRAGIREAESQGRGRTRCSPLSMCSRFSIQGFLARIMPLRCR